MKIFSPCKVNIMLAITGVRPDGFHNLLSLVAPVGFGDILSAEILDSTAQSDTLKCNMEGVPCDSSNLVVRAANLFREKTGIKKYFDFNLDKKVPAGAGLGGGSGNGAAALKLVNDLCQSPLDESQLAEIAAGMGSDCPLFLSGKPSVMRGRGDLVWPLGGEAETAVSKLRLFIFKPAFSINTGWAYSMMRANPADYADPDKSEAMLSEWLENPAAMPLPLFNNMQIEAFKKYPALEAMILQIREKFGVPAIMSGSGSACFAVVNSLSDAEIGNLKKLVLDGFGDSAFTAICYGNVKH